MSLLLSWRRFTFFDREMVKDPENPDQPYMGFQDMESVATCTGNGQVLIGETAGGVCQVNKKLQISFWKAHKVGLSQMFYVRQHNILVTVGDDDPGVNPMIKVWHFDKMDKGVPFCSRISKTSPGGRPAKVTSLVVHSSLFFMAVGFEDSTVLLYRGEVTKEKQNKAQVLRDGLTCAQDGAVTGMAFHMLPDRKLVLFIATSHLIISMVIREKDLERRDILDTKGCTENCWGMFDGSMDYQFVVAQREMVFFYDPSQCGSPEGPPGAAKCYGFEGEKSLVRCAGSYLVLVTRDVSAIESSGSGTKMHMVTVYDIAEQYIAYSAPVPEVMDVFYEWDALFVLCKNGKLYRLTEKDIQSKLDVLFRKNLFDLATNLARRYYCDEDNLSAIFKQHGDYLYHKGDYDNAVKQYIHTIGKLEPSYVIRKFLDAQRIKQLTQYLDALHKKRLASTDHTTILLNCYTKLDDKQKINEFVRACGKDLTFDIDTAIKVLRSSDYIDEALHLAKENEHHDMYLHILLDSKQDFKKAVKYIGKLKFHQVDRYVKKYGKILLREVPCETTTLLKELCTGFHSVDLDQPQKASPDEYIYIFVNDSKRLQDFLEHMAGVDPKSPSALYNTLLELYLREYCKELRFDLKEKEERILKFLKNPSSNYDIDQALVLCQIHNFGPGTLFVYEKAKLYQQILQYHMGMKDYGKVIETCRQYGRDSGNREMWIEALWFFARNEKAPMECIEALLKHIDELEILPPLMVLEILSHSHSVTLGVVKDYLLSWLKQENEKIKRDENLIEEYQEEIRQTQSVVHDLQNNAQVFQVSKCSACNSPLEVPTVHFLCKHSYHQSCFEGYAESEADCPMCLSENRKLKALLNLREKDSKETFSQFKTELQTSGDSMGTVADHFGKGLFQRSRSETMPPPAKVPSKKEPFNPFDEDEE